MTLIFFRIPWWSFKKGNIKHTYSIGHKSRSRGCHAAPSIDSIVTAQETGNRKLSKTQDVQKHRKLKNSQEAQTYQGSLTLMT